MDTIIFNFDTRSIRTTVQNIFNHLKNLDTLPTNITCLLPSLSTNYFYDPLNQKFFEYTFNKLEKDKSYFAPYDYTKLIDLDWIYYYNLNDIAMLENFCKLANINISWTTEDHIPESIYSFITKNFEGYYNNENY